MTGIYNFQYSRGCQDWSTTLLASLIIGYCYSSKWHHSLSITQKNHVKHLTSLQSKSMHVEFPQPDLLHQENHLPESIKIYKINYF